MAFLTILTFGVATSQPAKAAGAHCFGKAIVYVGDDAGSTIPNPIINLGELASYSTQLGHDKDCADRVSAAAASNAEFNNKTWLCQQIQRQGDFRVSAYAAVGTRDYRVAQSIFVHCSGGVRTCTCPPGWLANPTNVDGGVTYDGRCKKEVCAGNPVRPLPANGTPIGDWGFTWGASFVAWGTAANGGGAHCVVSPWVGI
jgi:hypothetical protein